MKIQISSLSEGIHHYMFKVRASELELGEQFHEMLTVHATLDKTPTQILLTANIHTQGRFECDRCVAPFTASLAPSYAIVYINEGSDTAHLDPSEFQVIPSGANIIDITEDVRQTILIAVPLKLLCSEQCKGLCPTCGKNLNEGACSCKEEIVDARWEQLRQLRAN
jgi:uncharacterized protein